MQSRKLNREEKKVLRGLGIKMIKFVGGLDQSELSLLCRIVLNKINKTDLLTVDSEDDDS